MLKTFFRAPGAELLVFFYELPHTFIVFLCICARRLAPRTTNFVRFHVYRFVASCKPLNIRVCVLSGDKSGIKLNGELKCKKILVVNLKTKTEALVSVLRACNICKC